MRSAGARVALALLVHGLLLAAPVVVLGQEAWSQPLLWLWLLGALGLHLVERLSSGDHLDERAEPSLDLRLALLTGLLLLGIQWAAAGEFLWRGLEPTSAWIAAGAGLITVGIALRGLAIRTLGSDFVSDVEGRPGGALCQEGVYAWSRHPSEVGLLAFALGFAFLLGSPLACAAVLFGLAPLVAVRLQREDRVLEDRFPDYPAYAARVGWVLPRVR
ncbi:MAG: isoprenylcysteine carboxylmethyltransferase family protein [Planctomycetes bacterium]|nr:isoprenylcysteine carboxylmethyltransferase family protein [Planctomycetota bacterium]